MHLYNVSVTALSPVLQSLCLVYVPDTRVTFLRCKSLCVETLTCCVCDSNDATLCLGDARNIRGIRIRVSPIAWRSGNPWVRGSGGPEVRKFGVCVFDGPTARGATAWSLVGSTDGHVS